VAGWKRPTAAELARCDVIADAVHRAGRRTAQPRHVGHSALGVALRQQPAQPLTESECSLCEGGRLRDQFWIGTLTRVKRELLHRLEHDDFRP
jgi:hypothetical protein